MFEIPYDLSSSYSFLWSVSPAGPGARLPAWPQRLQGSGVRPPAAHTPNSPEASVWNWDEVLRRCPCRPAGDVLECQVLEVEPCPLGPWWQTWWSLAAVAVWGPATSTGSCLRPVAAETWSEFVSWWRPRTWTVETQQGGSPHRCTSLQVRHIQADQVKK